MITCIQSRNFSNISIIPNKKYVNRPAFKSIEREVKNSIGEVQYRNNTYFFRNDLNWNKAIEQIIKTDPEKIYCYACSDGSEAYSIALGLIIKLGYEKAQKYFPIIAKDIDSEMINQANSGIIKLSSSDIERISLKLGQNSNIKEYFNKINNASDNDEHVMVKGIFFNDEKEKLNTYTVSDKLRKCVKFQTGDIITDSKDPKLYNSTIFIRNVWAYFSDEQTKELLQNIKTNLTDKTTIVVGGYDMDYYDDKEDNPKAFSDILFTHSLEAVYPLIFHKHNYSEKFSLSDVFKASANDMKNSVLSYLEFLKNCITQNK